MMRLQNSGVPRDSSASRESCPNSSLAAVSKSARTPSQSMNSCFILQNSIAECLRVRVRALPTQHGRRQAPHACEVAGLRLAQLVTPSQQRLRTPPHLGGIHDPYRIRAHAPATIPLVTGQVLRQVTVVEIQEALACGGN